MDTTMLTTCPACAQTVAISAKACPNCGAPKPGGVLRRPVPAPPRHLLKIALVLLAIAVGGLITFNHVKGSAQSDLDTANFLLSSTTEGSDAYAAAAGESFTPGPRLCETANNAATPDVDPCANAEQNQTDATSRLDNAKTWLKASEVLLGIAALMLLIGLTWRVRHLRGSGTP